MFENSTLLFGVIALILALLLSFLLAWSRASTQKQVIEATRAAKALSDFNRALIHETSLPIVLERITTALTQNLGFSKARMHLLDGVSRDGRVAGDQKSVFAAAAEHRMSRQRGAARPLARDPAICGPS